jgi:hypothetical protein
VRSVCTAHGRFQVTTSEGKSILFTFELFVNVLEMRCSFPFDLTYLNSDNGLPDCDRSSGELILLNLFMLLSSSASVDELRHNVMLSFPRSSSTVRVFVRPLVWQCRTAYSYLHDGSLTRPLNNISSPR